MADRPPGVRLAAMITSIHLLIYSDDARQRRLSGATSWVAERRSRRSEERLPDLRHRNKRDGGRARGATFQRAGLEHERYGLATMTDVPDADQVHLYVPRTL
jgi:hypothetical protein